MKTALIAALAACALATPALAQNNPFSGLKSKIKEGQWDYTMQMGAMPGMPAGMKMPEMKFTHCVTAADVEKGGFTSRDGKMPDGCTVKNFKMSGNTASYTMECVKEPKMKADVAMMFTGDSFTMKQDMEMDHGGQMMKMNNTMTGRHAGACKK